MLKHTTNSKERGFTLVELLIVIVVIAILAAISIVAYNGIQQRARNSAAEADASKVQTKVEAWNSELASYPTAAQVTGGLINADVTEAELEPNIRGRIVAGATPTREQPVAYEQCNGGTGARITFMVEPSGPNGEMIRGTGC